MGALIWKWFVFYLYGLIRQSIQFDKILCFDEMMSWRFSYTQPMDIYPNKYALFVSFVVLRPSWHKKVMSSTADFLLTQLTSTNRPYFCQ